MNKIVTFHQLNFLGQDMTVLHKGKYFYFIFGDIMNIKNLIF